MIQGAKKSIISHIKTYQEQCQNLHYKTMRVWTLVITKYPITTQALPSLLSKKFLELPIIGKKSATSRIQVSNSITSC